MDILYLIHKYMGFGLNIRRCNKQTNEWNVSHYDWKKISKLELDDEFVNEFQDYIIYRIYNDRSSKQVTYEEVSEHELENASHDYFNSLAVYHPMSESYLASSHRTILPEQWYTLWMFQDFSEEFLENHKSYWTDEVWTFQNLSEEFIERNLDVVNFDLVFKNQKISEKFVLKYLDKVNDVKKIYIDQQLSDEFYLTYKWSPLLIHKKTSEKLIRDNVAILDMKSFLINKKHSEELLEFVLQHHVLNEEEWSILWMIQRVSTSFILKYRKYIKDLEHVIWSQNISIQFVKQLLLE